MKNVKKVESLAVMVAMAFVVTALPAWAQQAPVDRTHTAAVADTIPVTWDTFVRAESDKYMKSYVELGGFVRRST